MTQNWQAPQDMAFVIVDPQKDFCGGGKLAVPGGEEIIPLLNVLKPHFARAYLTKDWHPAGHSSFASAHPGKAPFDLIQAAYGEQRLWPDHCVQGTDGAEFHAAFKTGPDDLILHKGTDPKIDSYSDFFEHDRKTKPRFADGQSFAEKLRQDKITRVVFAGLAYDYCVGWNALDAKAEGFDVIVIKDASRAITKEGEAAMTAQLAAAGVKVVNTNDFPRVLSAPTCPSAPKP